MTKKGYKQSPEHLEKNRQARMNHHPSEETREKMRLAKLGENNHNFGKKFSEETRAKLSASMMGRNVGVPRPEHVRKAIGDAHRGEKHHNFGKPLSDELKEKIRIATSGEKNHNYGTKFSDGTREKIAESRVGTHPTEETRIKMSASHQGVPEDDWKQFSSVGVYCKKWTDPILKIRKRVRARYKNICIFCGAGVGDNDNKQMSVHHVTRDKTTCCDGNKSEWLFATLCKQCHSREGNKHEFETRMREIIALQYGNKCMLSLEEYTTKYPHGSIMDQQWGRRNGT
jgi:cytochrome c553